MKRPPFCIISHCAPKVGYELSAEDLSNGRSCFCLGELDEMETWNAKTEDHPNDLCFCLYTPFKGWTRFMMNNADLETIGELISGFQRKTGRKIMLYGPNGKGYRT